MFLSMYSPRFDVSRHLCRMLPQTIVDIVAKSKEETSASTTHGEEILSKNRICIWI